MVSSKKTKGVLMTNYSFVLIAQLNLNEYVAASAGFLDHFPVVECYLIHKFGFDNANNLATFSIISTKPLDEEATWTFIRDLHHTVAKEKILFYFNHLSGLEPTHSNTMVVKVSQFPSILIETIHHRLTLQRFGLHRCDHVVQKLSGDLVAISFRSLEDTTDRVHQLVADSLKSNHLIFNLEV